MWHLVIIIFYYSWSHFLSIDFFFFFGHNSFLCSSSNSFHEEDPYNGEEAFASEQGRGSDDDEPNYEVPISDRLINYQSYMDKTPRTRWSKQDTELFYEVYNVTLIFLIPLSIDNH